ncbi:MAG: hypothetical protein C0467_14275 [Planctomycetaceae bacterium]|nr:hypothetical protein [Planctomycetaceae bacterium]
MEQSGQLSVTQFCVTSRPLPCSSCRRRSVFDSPTVSPLGVGNVPPRWPAIAAAVVFFGIALGRAVGPPDGDPRDFFIYRLGAELVCRGENPYDIAKIRHHVGASFAPENSQKPFNNSPALNSGDFGRWLVLLVDECLVNSFPLNCGYFLPPMAVLLYMPFALLPWLPAKVAWALVNGIAAYFIARLPVLLRLHNSPPIPVFIWAVVPFLLLMDPSIAPVIVFPVGQTSVLAIAFVSAGLIAYERGRFSLMAVLWIFPFVKPHLAISLIPLMWYLGGWRPALLLVVLVASLNLIGATVIGGSPLFLKDYADFLPSTRDAVRYNRIELNPSIASWNQLVFAFGGPLLELGIVTTVAGYLVWYGFLMGRWTWSGERPSAAWATAATVAGAVWCSQVLVYELILLLAAVPWVRDLYLGGYRIRSVTAACLLAIHWVPRTTMEGAGFPAHHPIAVALFALVVLTGPLNPVRTPSPESPTA